VGEATPFFDPLAAFSQLPDLTSETQEVPICKAFSAIHAMYCCVKLSGVDRKNL
jgi:hypothetical protein